MPRSRLLSFALLSASLVACTNPAGDERDDDFLSGGKADGAISEGSPEAIGVLTVVNSLDEDALDDDVGLDARAADGIASHRAAGDGALDTADDDDFQTLAELDAIPYVGKTAFGKLLAYAQAHGLVGAGGGAWQLENPSPDASSRHAVWATSANDVWAVGEAGLVEHFDGSTWTTLDAGTQVTFSSVWASSANDVWLAGQAGTVVHYDGTSFTHVDSTTTRDLFNVYGSGPTDVWFVGANDPNAYAGEIVHWDGAQMTKQRTGLCPNPLYTVFASAPNDVWVAGGVKTVCHWDGTTWSDAQIDDSYQGDVGDIWRGPTTTWATYSGEIYQRVGTTWTKKFELPRIDGGWTIPGLYRLTGTSDTDIWASGTHGYVAHFDGTSWTATRMPGDASYAGIAVTGSVGWAVGPQARARYAGGQWNETYDVVTRQWLWSASASTATNMWALGSQGDVVRRDASGWSKLDSPFQVYIDSQYTVLATGTDEAWLGGDKVAHYDGQAFELYPEITDVHAFWSGSSSDVWAVGDGGTMAHFDGSAWTKMMAPAYATYVSLSGTAGDDVWTVGGSYVLHYDGTTWSQVDIGLGQNESTSFVVALAADDVWVGGYTKYVSAALHHFDGQTWTTLPIDGKSFVSGARVVSSSDITFVVRRDGLVHWDGQTLTAEAMPGAAAIASAGSTMWVTGEDGKIWRK